MTFRHLFSRQSRLALLATPGRNMVTWSAIIAVGAPAWVWPDLLPWWGWTLLAAGEFVGLAFLGRFWADKDIAHSTDCV